MLKLNYLAIVRNFERVTFFPEGSIPTGKFTLSVVLLVKSNIAELVRQKKFQKLVIKLKIIKGKGRANYYKTTMVFFILDVQYILSIIISVPAI